LNAFKYSPDRAVTRTSADLGVDFHDLAIPTEDGEQLHGW
jgi:hypothetical protein